MIKYIGDYETIEENHIYSIEKKNNFLTSSSVFNSGLAEIYKFKIDNDFTLDENLNDFIEYIEEEETKTPL